MSVTKYEYRETSGPMVIIASYNYIDYSCSHAKNTHYSSGVLTSAMASLGSPMLFLRYTLSFLLSDKLEDIRY